MRRCRDIFRRLVGFSAFIGFLGCSVPAAYASDVVASDGKYLATVKPVDRYFENIVTDWKTTVLHLLDHPALERYVVAHNSNQTQLAVQYQQQVEQLFADLTRSPLNFIQSIRFTDSEGDDKIIATDGVAFRKYKQRAREPYFQAAMRLADYEISKMMFLPGSSAILALNAPFISNGFVYGIVTVTININALAENINAMMGLTDYSISVLANSANLVSVISARKGVLEKSQIGELEEKIVSDDKKNRENQSFEYAGTSWAILRTSDRNLGFAVQLPEGASATEPGHYNFFMFLLLLAAMTGTYFATVYYVRRVQQGNDANETVHSRSKFLANVSHELRTPLSGMLGMMALLRDSKLTKEQNKQLSSAQRSGEFMLQLINDFLDFSKIDSGKLNLEFIDFDLRTLLDDIIESLSVPAYAKGLDIACITASAVPTRINGDPTRLRQILTNLIGNAVKFTDTGDVAINIKMLEQADKPLVIRFEVIDTGYGIDAEQVDEIFKPFVQGDVSISRKFGGTGLGLAISKQLVELMGGEIGAKENSSGGSTFWFTVPFESATEMSKFVIDENLTGCRVLVAGQVSVNRQTILDALQEWGMLCESADDLAETATVLDAATKSKLPFELCILDVSLSFSNQQAFELVESIRHMPGLETVRIVVLTADGTPGDGAIAKTVGIQAYLTKPISRSQLHNCLLQLMRYESIRDIPLITRHRLNETKARDGVKILVVEDDEVNLKVAVGLLAKCGYHADVATDGEQALSALKEKHYDIVFLDNNLPDMSGVEIARAFRKMQTARTQAQLSPTTLIALTADAAKENIKACLAAGMNDHLTKPYTLTTLGATLNRWLEPEETAVDDSVFVQEL